MVGVNSAFTTLRTLIPTEPVDRKLSKIETLRLASSYISHLQAQLLADCPRPFVCVFFIVLGVISTHPVIANLNVALVSRAVARGIGARGKQSCVSTVFTDIQSTRGFKKTAQRMHILHCKPEKI
uniref:BHLH domain-containing protein n=1 Tax=Timema douglasi TaxID=61478 RepID=A0A7R8Z5N3_TIMDO|nr:unnamed protein product [Timema douglasi]